MPDLMSVKNCYFKKSIETAFGKLLRKIESFICGGLALLFPKILFIKNGMSLSLTFCQDMVQYRIVMFSRVSYWLKTRFNCKALKL